MCVNVCYGKGKLFNPTVQWAEMGGGECMGWRKCCWGENGTEREGYRKMRGRYGEGKKLQQFES